MSLRPTQVRLALHTWTRTEADHTTQHLPWLWCILAPSHDHVKCRGSSIPQQKRRRIVMESTITTDIVVAYSQCPRKAYLLLFSPDKGEPHAYIQLLEQQQRENQERYIDHLKHKHADVQPYSLEN